MKYRRPAGEYCDRSQRIHVSYKRLINRTHGRSSGVILEMADGSRHWFSLKYCALNERENSIEAPIWLMEKKGFQVYG